MFVPTDVLAHAKFFTHARIVKQVGVLPDVGVVHVVDIACHVRENFHQLLVSCPPGTRWEIGVRGIHR